MSVELRAPAVEWPNKDLSMQQALMLASQSAYAHFYAAVEHARLSKKTRMKMDNPAYYNVGKFSFHWSVFVHGLRRQGKRDRSPWANHGLLVPFEQLRRGFAQDGLYVVLNYEKRSPAFRVFDKDQITADPDFTVMDVHEKPQYVYRRTTGRNFYNIVPF